MIRRESGDRVGDLARKAIGELGANSLEVDVRPIGME